MPETRIIDVVELGRGLGVPEGRFTAPNDPNGFSVVMQYWTKEHLHSAFKELEPQRALGGRVGLFGHVEAWVMLALAHFLMPACEVCYIAPLRKGEVQLLELELSTPLPQGRSETAQSLRYSIKEADERLLIEYDADGSGDENVHLMEPDALPQLVLPEIPQGRHVFLRGNGAFSAQVMIANGFAPHAKSVWTSYRDDTRYYCALSRCAEMEPGDVMESVL